MSSHDESDGEARLALFRDQLALVDAQIASIPHSEQQSLLDLRSDLLQLIQLTETELVDAVRSRIRASLDQTRPHPAVEQAPHRLVEGESIVAETRCSVPFKQDNGRAEVSESDYYRGCHAVQKWKKKTN